MSELVCYFLFMFYVLQRRPSGRGEAISGLFKRPVDYLNGWVGGERGYEGNVRECTV